MITKIKTGVDKEGRVAARDIACHMDGGAYSSTGPIATSVPFLCMEQAYRMENVRYNGYRILTNKPIRGMFRTHGRTFACGVDSQLDMLGEALGIDPLTMRLRNARQTGDTTPTKSYVASCGLTETIEKSGKVSRWKEKFGKLPPYHGSGIGCNSVQTGFPMGIRGGSQAFIKLNEDVGVTVITGIVDNADCRTSPQHHGDMNCSCSCHVVVVLPAIPVDEWPANSFDLALTLHRSRPSVFLNHPEPPPRT